MRISFATTAVLLSHPASAAPTDLIGLSLAVASERIRRRATSPVELTEVCLERIDKLNQKLNAFITITREAALAQARNLDADLQRGKWRGPLHGIPVALKDNIDTAGIETTSASKVFAERKPTEDAEVVRRLKEAGAILLGKLNMHECAFGTTSATSHFGPVANPWKLDHSAGGSSGGSAAAVAAGLCYGAIGTDTGGSVRLPAAYCGIVGLRPTYGLVSIRGVMPLAWTLDTVGPMFRTVADAALLLQAMVGYDLRDPVSVKAPPVEYPAAQWARTATLRLGKPRGAYYEKLDEEIERAVGEAFNVLEGLTTGIHAVDLPLLPALPIEPVEAYTYHEQYLKERSQDYQAETRDLLQNGGRISPAIYAKARWELDRVRREIRDVFATVDLLITPTTPSMPVTVEEGKKPPPPGPPFRIRNTRPLGVYGLPSVSVLCGFSKGGLPIGLQISGPPFGEAQVLAHAYEQATGWHKRRPDLS